MALKSGNSLESLLMDLNFRDWVIQSKPETERYWKTWLKNNPDKKEDFLLAKELIQKLELYTRRRVKTKKLKNQSME